MNDASRKLKVIVAPNAFKGSLTAMDAAKAMEQGIMQANAQTERICFPVADGGDGLFQVLEQTGGLERKITEVTDPLGRPISTNWLLDQARGSAWIEMASVAGLALLEPAEYSVMQTSTVGVGELIRAALDAGARKIMLGIGGSATNDGGMGVCAALGMRFLDASGNQLTPCGESLGLVHTIDCSNLDARLARLEFTVLCDVRNPLLGKLGAAHVYAPQKGATPEQVQMLETGMQHYAGILKQTTGRDVRTIPGGGAAGGLGGGLYALLNAQLRPGAEVLLEYLDFDKALKGASLVLTTEGRLDDQSAFGKAPVAVAKRAKFQGIPCIVITGSYAGSGNRYNDDFDACFSLCPGPVSLEEAMGKAAEYLTDATEQVIRCYQTGMDCSK